jgi:ATP/maltotriose-dependent transcriptional regulator MalT
VTRASDTASPAATPWLLERPVLRDRLQEAFERRLTTVIAGPGYGKSTLLGTWVAEVGGAWYAVDRDDNDLSVIVPGLIASLGMRIDIPPELDASALLQEGSSAHQAERAEAIAGHVSQILESCLEADLVLVMDDVHEIDAGTPTVRLVEALVRHAPSRLSSPPEMRFGSPSNVSAGGGRCSRSTLARSPSRSRKWRSCWFAPSGQKPNT